MEEAKLEEQNSTIHNDKNQEITMKMKSSDEIYSVTDNLLNSQIEGKSYFNKNENNKFCTFDEIKIDNQLGNTDFESFCEEIKSIAQYLKQFNILLINVLDHDLLICKSLVEYNFSREKILIYTLFTERAISLIYHFACIQYTGIEEPQDQRSLNPDNLRINFDECMINETVKQMTTEIYNQITKNKLLDITEEETSNLYSIIAELLNSENSIIKKGLDKNFKTSLTGIIICIKYLGIVLDDFSNLINLFKLDIGNNSHLSEIKQNDENLDESFNKNRDKVFFQEEVLNMFSHYNRLKYLQTFIVQSFMVNEDDLFNQGIKSKSWKKIISRTDTVVLYSQMTMRAKIQKIFDMIILGSAFVSKGHEIEEGLLRTLGTGMYMTHFFFSKKDAKRQAKKFNTEPKLEVAKQVWSLLDNKGIRLGLKLTLTSIPYRQKFFFRRIKKPITYEYLQGLTLKLHNSSALNDHLNSYENNHDYIDPGKEDIIKTEVNSETWKDYVKIKFLHTSTIITNFDNKNPGFFSCFNCSKTKNYTRDALVIHIHGGGFVAMSTTSHENYLRKWCKMIDAPIISIDYRLAPDHPYPSALDDVYQAYCYILKYATSELMIELNKIILIGDSAGGCLAMGLINLLISKGHKTPDALFLCYPCMRLDVDFFSPSKIITLKDQILSINFLMLCKEAYFGNNNIPSTDFFCNPINTPDHVSIYIILVP